MLYYIYIAIYVIVYNIFCKLYNLENKSCTKVLPAISLLPAISCLFPKRKNTFNVDTETIDLHKQCSNLFEKNVLK